MHRNPSILVWLPYNETYLVADAISVRITRDSVLINTVRKRKIDIREYVTFPTARNNKDVCFLVNTISKDES